MTHLLPPAPHLLAGASVALELPEQRRAYQNNSPVLADIRIGTEKVLPAV